MDLDLVGGGGQNHSSKQTKKNVCPVGEEQCLSPQSFLGTMGITTDEERGPAARKK